MGPRILLFTSNVYGGIIQFTTTIFSNLAELGYDVYCMLPENVELSDELTANKRIIKYSTRNSKIRVVERISRMLINNPSTKSVCNTIHTLQPDLVWFMDDPIFTIEVAWIISEKYRTLLTLHDANSGHPMNRSIYDVFVDFYYLNLKLKVEKRVEHILLLSGNSLHLFNSSMPKLKDKACMMKLGAHIPCVNEKKPDELEDKEYYLFFGRIDKYKGIENLLLAYNMEQKINTKLVIAGDGKFTETEKALLAESNVCLIKRFVADSEMIWLFRNARAVVLPYIQATQSGVIPIAYTFGVPVIVSNVEGLTQSVIDRETGYICSTPAEIHRAMKLLEDNDIRDEMGNNSMKYSKENYDWKKNISDLFTILNIGDKR